VAAHLDGRVERDLRAGLVDPLVVHEHPPREQQRLRALATLDEAALDQELVDPRPAAHAPRCLSKYPAPTTSAESSSATTTTSVLGERRGGSTTTAVDAALGAGAGARSDVGAGAGAGAARITSASSRAADGGTSEGDVRSAGSSASAGS